MASDEIVAGLRKQADRLEQGIRGLVGLGVMTAADIDAVADLTIAHDILDADKVDVGRLPNARAAIIRGEKMLELLISGKSVGWRLLHVHQVPLFAYHLVFVAIFIAIGTSCATQASWCVVPNAVLGGHIPVVVLAMGGLGAQLRAISFLWQQVGRRLYFRRFLLGQLAAPFMGMLLGIITYLLAKAGLFVVGGKASADANDTASVGELALSFFVGFKWEWALKRIEQIFEKTEKPGPAKNDPTPGRDEAPKTKTGEHR
jgi:hypothetical protein